MNSAFNSLSYFISDPQSQVGPYLLALDSSSNNKIIELACITLIMTSHKSSSQYLDPFSPWGDHSSASEASDIVRSVLPKVNLHSSYPVVSFDTGHVTRAWWPVDLVMAWAKVRNSLPNCLVSEDAHGITLVYTALALAHEWRVDAIKKSIKTSGPTFGSATGFHTISFMEDVKDWPERFNFEGVKVSPLPGEDLEFYAREIEEWETKQAEDAKDQK